jgi:hypothetical protein
MDSRDRPLEVASRGYNTDSPRLLMQPLTVTEPMLVNIQTLIIKGNWRVVAFLVEAASRHFSRKTTALFRLF